MDRSSGSGVFARDPDAILDLIELPLTEERHSYLEDKAVCKLYQSTIKQYNPSYEINQDDVFSKKQMSHHLMAAIQSQGVLKQTEIERQKVVRAARQATAWRIEGTLREFPKFDPINVWFRYPVHELDETLKDIQLEEDPKAQSWKKGTKKSNESRSEKSKQELETAFSALSMDGNSVDINELAEYLDIDKRSVHRKVKKHDSFKVIDGMVEKNTNDDVTS